MKHVIIGIHGLGNKPPKPVLKKWWKLSMREGLIKAGRERLFIPFELVYWADLLHEKPLEIKMTTHQNPLLDREPYLPGTMLAAEPQAKPSWLLGFIENQLDKIFLNDDMSLNLRGVTDKIIHKYFKDLESYYTESRLTLDEQETIKTAIQNRLFKVLHKYRHYKILLIAHSMGSIVAYDVLSPQEQPMVHSMVTIGSPLGLPVIVGRILAEQKERGNDLDKPRVPESIRDTWVNMSDYRDKVALDHTLADDYEKNSRGLLVEDKFVYNDYSVDGEANPHKAYGYLRTKEMTESIDTFLPDRIWDKVYRAVREKRRKN